MKINEKCKPILFNTEMVRAILDGRKTETRRVIKPTCLGGEILSETSPYRSDDYLYVRETWAHPSEIEIKNGADPNMYLYAADPLRPAAWGKWHPSIHMPKEAARIFLRVTDVRVERLQEITEEGAKAEGIPTEYPMNPVYCPRCKGIRLVGTYHPGSLGFVDLECSDCVSEIVRFKNLWNSTVKSADRDKYGWDANPWVWVISFERAEEEK